MEATGNWYCMYGLLEDSGLELKLFYLAKTGAIVSAKIKTDKINSRSWYSRKGLKIFLTLLK